MHLSVPPPTAHPGCVAEGSWRYTGRIQPPKNTLITLTLADLKDTATEILTKILKLKQSHKKMYSTRSL